MCTLYIYSIKCRLFGRRHNVGIFTPPTKFCRQNTTRLSDATARAFGTMNQEFGRQLHTTYKTYREHAHNRPRRTRAFVSAKAVARHPAAHSNAQNFAYNSWRGATMPNKTTNKSSDTSTYDDATTRRTYSKPKAHYYQAPHTSYTQTRNTHKHTATTQFVLIVC